MKLILIVFPKYTDIFISSLMDAKLYFHKINQFLDLSGRMGYVVHLKEKLQTQINTHDLRY